MGQRRSNRLFLILVKVVVPALVLCCSLIVYILVSKNDNNAMKKVSSQPVIDSARATEVEVLDATGSTKKALDVVQFLRSKGYDVVEYRRLLNEPIDKSYIIVYNSTKLEDGKKIAALLSIDQKRISTKSDPKALVDISVLIAKDIR